MNTVERMDLSRFPRIKSLFLVLTCAAFLGAAGSDRSAADRDAPTERGGVQEAVEIVIRPVDNQMLYDVTEFEVEAGQEVTIVLENTATNEAMQHNVVVLTSDEDEVVDRVGQAAIAAGPDAEYIPEDDAVLAHTALAPPGETVRVTFTAPSEAGNYRYICTFPGHYVMMQGTMTVT